jgi:hypothetical protein
MAAFFLCFLASLRGFGFISRDDGDSLLDEDDSSSDPDDWEDEALESERITVGLACFEPWPRGWF